MESTISIYFLITGQLGELFSIHFCFPWVNFLLTFKDWNGINCNEFFNGIFLGNNEQFGLYSAFTRCGGLHLGGWPVWMSSSSMNFYLYWMSNEWRIIWFQKLLKRTGDSMKMGDMILDKNAIAVINGVCTFDKNDLYNMLNNDVSSSSRTIMPAPIDGQIIKFCTCSIHTSVRFLHVVIIDKWIDDC